MEVSKGKFILQDRSQTLVNWSWKWHSPKYWTILLIRRKWFKERESYKAMNMRMRALLVVILDITYHNYRLISYYLCYVRLILLTLPVVPFRKLFSYIILYFLKSLCIQHQQSLSPYISEKNKSSLLLNRIFSVVSNYWNTQVNLKYLVTLEIF